MTWRTNTIKVLPFVLLLFSSLLIFYQFPVLPRNLSFDEIEFSRLALSLQDSGYMPYSNLATGHSTLYFYILLFSLNLFGITNFALRLPAALFGVLNVLLLYSVFKNAFSYLLLKKDNLKVSIIAFLLSLVFLTSHWYFNFTRFAFEVTFLIFLELLSLLFLLKYHDSKRNIFIILSGIFAGLSYLSYTPGRLFFIVPAIYFLLIVRAQKNLKLMLYYIIPFIIIMLPLTFYLLQNPDIRLNQVSYLNKTDINLSEKLSYFGSNVFKTIGMFFWQGDLNGRQNYPGKPALNPILATLFFGGLIIALKKFKTFPNYLFIIYFFISLVPTLLTYPQENPHMLRTVTSIISTIYFIGLFIITLEKYTKSYKNIYWVGLSVLLLFSMLYELRTYFVYQATVFPEAFEYYGNLSELIYKLPKLDQ